MRLESVRIRGFGPFPDEVKLDLADLGEALLVAVCGDNGEGKSSLLELALPGAFYRKTPTQGSLRDRATARDALLEVVVAGAAATYTIRHLVDGVSGKGESVVLDDAGKPLYGSNKVSDFDAWAMQHLPPEEVLLASTFGAQQDRGFLGASPSDRKGILLRALGIARYEAWAASAADRARACRQALEVTRARLDEARRTGGDVTELAAALAGRVAEAKRLDDALSAARLGLSTMEASAREAEAASAAHAAYAAQQGVLRARIVALEGKKSELEARMAACNRTLSQENAIRDAASKLEALRQQLVAMETQRGTLTARQESAEERRRSAVSQLDAALAHHGRVTVRVQELEVLVARGAEVAQAETDLRETEAGLVVLRERSKSAQATLDELMSATVEGVEGRVALLLDGHQIIWSADVLEDARRVARACLDTDARTVRDASERPTKLHAARKAVDDCRGLVTSTERRYQTLSALARRAGEVTAARDQIASLRVELGQHGASLRTHQTAAEEAAVQVVSCTDQLNALSMRVRGARDQTAPLEALASQLPNIALAASKLEERKLQQAEVAGELEAATWALTELGPLPAPVAVPDLAPLRAECEQAERAARAAHSVTAVAANRVEVARGMEAQVRKLDEQQGADETELSDWSRLAEDLGRKGLQAAEIDGCGPELTTLVNDLLHSAHGPRFTLRIDTQLASADGKKTLEGCQVTVMDTVEGREDEGSKFSGGERVIIGEALALGLSMLACQRSGMRGVTLVRDETGAALDPGNAEVYVKMLRRAAVQIGADRVLFVCHNPEVSELADARITVIDGRVVIDAQPAQPARAVA